MKRDEWVKLSSKEKVLHRTQWVIDSLDASQKRYGRERGREKHETDLIPSAMTNAVRIRLHGTAV